MENKTLEEMTLEEKDKKVKELRAIDDVFFEVLANNKPFCEEILTTIMEDPGIKVQDVVVQSSERNLYGRSVRLDALCSLGTGEKVNIEVQRSNDDNHIRRTRYNASVITGKNTPTGCKFEDVQDLIIVYISEFDIFRKGKTMYHVENYICETGDIVDDGLHRIFVNTEVDDGSKVAELMSCFTKKMVNNPHFPVFTKRMHELKETEKGMSAVCEVMKKYEDIAREEGVAGERLERARSIIRTCAIFGGSDDQKIERLEEELDWDHDTAEAFLKKFHEEIINS